MGKAPAGTKVFQPGPANMGQHGLPKGQKWDEDRNHIGNIVGIVGIVAIIYIYISQEHCGTLLDRSWDISTIINNEMESSGNGDKSRLKMRSSQKWRGWVFSNP